MYYSTGIELIFSDILKPLPISNKTWASDETTHHFSGLPKESFEQVS